MIGVGGVTAKHYPETKGLKKSGGQFVKKGTILTRQGNKWKAGLNVGGKEGSLYALCDGTVNFSSKKGSYKTKKKYTSVNIKPEAKK